MSQRHGWYTRRSPAFCSRAITHKHTHAYNIIPMQKAHKTSTNTIPRAERLFAHANNALNPSAFMEHQTLPWASLSKHEHQNVKPVQVRALVDNQTLHPCILEHLRSTKTLRPCRFERGSRIWTDKGRVKAHLDTVARIQNVSQTEIKQIRLSLIHI